MELNETHIISDYSPATLLEISARIERSTSEEQLIYRECELDEVWRLLDATINNPTLNHELQLTAKLVHLRALRDVTVEAHDLIGVHNNAAEAATRLRAALLKLPTTL